MNQGLQGWKQSGSELEASLLPGEGQAGRPLPILYWMIRQRPPIKESRNAAAENRVFSCFQSFSGWKQKAMLPEHQNVNRSKAEPWAIANRSESEQRGSPPLDVQSKKGNRQPVKGDIEIRGNVGRKKGKLLQTCFHASG